MSILPFGGLINRQISVKVSSGLGIIQTFYIWNNLF